MKVFGTLILFAALFLYGCATNTSPEETIYSEKELLTALKEKRYEVVKSLIMPNVEVASPLALLVSSNALLTDDRDHNLEDAAFLFYIGRIRAIVDLDFFKTDLTGGSSPGVFFSGMVIPLRSYIYKNLPQHPKAFINVVEQIENWHGKYTKNYKPGWESDTSVNVEQLERQLENNKQELLQDMTGVSTLLKNSEYSMFIKELHKGPSDERRIDIIQKMEEIESSSGTNGFIYLLKKNEQNKVK